MITSMLAGLTPAKDAVWRHDGGGRWTKIAENFGGTLDITGGPFGLVVTRSGGLNTGSWLVHKDRNITLAGLGGAGFEGFVDRTARYASTSSAIYRLNEARSKVEQLDVYGGGVGFPPQPHWTQIGSGAADIIAHAWGLCAIEPTTKSVWHFSGTPNVWSQIGGPAKQFAVTADSVYGLTPDGGAVFRYGGGESWTAVGGSQSSIVGGVWGVVSTDARGDLHHYENQPNQWKKIGGPGAQFAVGDDTAYGLTSDRAAVYEYVRSTNSWNQVGGPASKIATFGLAS